MTYPCANCGREMTSTKARAGHERRGHPGWYPPAGLLRSRELERWASRDPEAQRAARQRYVERHRDRIAERRRQWTADNPERTALSQAKYRMTHREAMRRRTSAYRKTPDGRRHSYYIRQQQIADGKHSARMAVTRAIADGALERKPCRICGHALLMRNYTPRGNPAQMTHPVQEPAGTVTGSDHHSLITTPFLTDYHGEGSAQPVGEPHRTMDTRDRYGLVEPSIDVEECGFRMLEPHEIGRAMAFDDSYIVLGNKRERVRQYGNAVTPPVMAMILGRAIGSLSGERVA